MPTNPTKPDQDDEALRVARKFHAHGFLIESKNDAQTESCIQDVALLIRLIREAAEEREKWIPVEEKAPELGKSVLVWHEPTKLRFIAPRVRGIWYDIGGSTTGVTHWMPLPNPPKAEVERVLEEREK